MGTEFLHFIVVKRWFYATLKCRLIEWCDWLKSKIQQMIYFSFKSFERSFVISLGARWCPATLDDNLRRLNIEIWIERRDSNVMSFIGPLDPWTLPCGIFSYGAVSGRRICWRVSMFWWSSRVLNELFS